MKSLKDFILEAQESNSDSKAFFKAWKKLINSRPDGGEWYQVVNGWVKEFGLTSLEGSKPEPATKAPMMTMILSKKKENHLLDVAVTRPVKDGTIEGTGTIDLTEISPIWRTNNDYVKWYKGYRNIRLVQFAFPDNFFKGVRTNLANKLIV